MEGSEYKNIGSTSVGTSQNIIYSIYYKYLLHRSPKSFPPSKGARGMNWNSHRYHYSTKNFPSYQELIIHLSFNPSITSRT